MLRSLKRLWGGDRSEAEERQRFGVVDVLVVAGLAGILFGILRVASEWRGALRPTVEIDLSPAALPRYTFFSLSRGVAAYIVSLFFTLGYGYWAAKDKRAERILIPLLDVLQSIPVLGFMPGVVLALVALFPSTNVGLELAAVLMIFTGQAWNMTFSYYHSLRSVPGDMREVSTLYRFGAWRRWRSVEMPFATTGLVWNSMMSMAGGWFFLMINEAFVLGDRDFRLPGLGSYMSVAASRGNVPAMAGAMIAMTCMIVFLDQVLWRPLVVWARKFRVEEGGAQDVASSWMLDLIRGSKLVDAMMGSLHGARNLLPKARHSETPAASGGALNKRLSMLPVVLLVVLLGVGAVRLVHLLAQVPGKGWTSSLTFGALTLGRVLAATAIGTLWALPAGLAIGLSPNLSRVLQPIVQVLASFPAPMLFPIAITVLKWIGVPLGWGSIVLMLLGTQWYILFNVLAGATAVPSDLRESATSYRLSHAKKFWHVYLPAVFPYLVTGWVTATGGAWNASIVAEYVTFKGEVLTAPGLGSQISVAAEKANLPLLAASVTVMSLLVVAFNRTVWRACYRVAETRFSLSK
jgi:NitT/TauT family transport system permease protein